MTAKKPARKAPKAARKKAAVKKPNSSKPLVVAAPENCFWVNHGPILKDLRDLHDALASELSDRQLAHHVSKEKNDFATWVETILGDSSCAKALRRVRTRKAMLAAVEKHLAQSRL